MTALEEEGLLPEILQHVGQLSDLLTCTKISRTWHAASQDVQPLHIGIGAIDRLPISMAGLTTMLQWLQRQQSQRNLDNVHGLTLDVDEGFEIECHSKRHVLVFCQSVLTLAGCLPLLSCELSGNLQLEAAISLVPVSLQNFIINVTRYEQPHIIQLSMFERLVGLQTLSLDVEYQVSMNGNYAHVLLDAKLPSLQTLIVSPRMLKPASVIDWATFLPSLQSINAHIPVFQAQAMLAHPSLKHAKLTLIGDDLDSDDSGLDYLKCHVDCVLRIEEHSKLQSLALDCERVRVQLNIAKPNISFDCGHGVSVRFRGRSKTSFLPITVRC